MKTQKPNNILLLGIYSGHRVAEHLRYLDDLRNKNLVNKIYLIDSTAGKGYPYPFDISCFLDGKLEREYSEAGKEDPKMYKKYVKDVLNFVKDKEIDLIIPTSDKGAYLTSNNFDSKLRTSPDKKILEMFQNKINTYNFFNENEFFEIPKFLTINPEKFKSNYSEIDDFFKKNPLAFAKPSYPQKGGGVGAGKVESIDELKKLIDSSPIKGDFILSEFLYFPEYNHSVIINKEGNISSQFSYFRDENKKIITSEINELNSFGFKFSESLKKNYPIDYFKGVYNIDFMKSKNNEFILSEINPGRFPVNLGAFRDEENEFNPLEALILSNSTNTIYNKKIKLNKEYKK